jgi:hypothetical protein
MHLECGVGFRQHRTRGHIRPALLDWNDDRLAFLRNDEIDSLRLI